MDCLVDTNPGGESLFITNSLSIPLAELRFEASRAGGPGGQHVNKVSTRITLVFDVLASPSLSAWQRGRIMERLGARVNQQGVLRLSSGEFRSQSVNKAQVKLRFAELLRAALEPVIPRRKTKPTLGSKLKRLESKKRRSQVKRQRGRADD